MADVSDLYEIVDGVVVLRVHAVPGAGRSAVTGRYGDAVKIRVAAPPVDGRANDALTEFLAAELGLKRSDVTLLSGQAHRTKRFRLGGLAVEDADAAIERLFPPPGPSGRPSGRR